MRPWAEVVTGLGHLALSWPLVRNGCRLLHPSFRAPLAQLNLLKGMQYTRDKASAGRAGGGARGGAAPAGGGRAAQAAAAAAGPGSGPSQAARITTAAGRMEVAAGAGANEQQGGAGGGSGAGAGGQARPPAAGGNVVGAAAEFILTDSSAGQRRWRSPLTARRRANGRGGPTSRAPAGEEPRPVGGERRPLAAGRCRRRRKSNSLRIYVSTIKADNKFVQQSVTICHTVRVTYLSPFVPFVPRRLSPNLSLFVPIVPGGQGQMSVPFCPFCPVSHGDTFGQKA